MNPSVQSSPTHPTSKTATTHPTPAHGATPLKAVCYLRVSSEGQLNGTSLSEQFAITHAKADALGAQVIGTYQDAAVSGGLYLTRPGIHQAIEQIETGQASVLIVSKLDRYSRDREHQTSIKKRVENAGGRLVLCDMDLDGSPEADLLHNVCGDFAQYERQLIRERTTKGKRRKALEGKMSSRKPHFGAYIVSKADVLVGNYPPGMDGQYILIEDEAATARQIFEMFAGGASLRKIGRHLEERGTKAPRGGVSWLPSTIRCIILNPAFKGEAAWGKKKRYTDEKRLEQGLSIYFSKRTAQTDWVYVPVPAIVPADLWERCQIQLAQNQGLYSGNPTRKNMLTGLLRCPLCCKSMMCQNKRKSRSRTKANGEVTTHNYRYNSYHCPDFAPRGAPECKCSNAKTTYNGRLMESLTLDAVLEVARQPHLVETAIAAYYDFQHKGEENRDHQRISKEIEKLRIKEDNIVNGHIRALEIGVGVSIYEDKLRAVSLERTTLESHLQDLEGRGAGQKVPDIQDEAGQLHRVLSAVEVALTASEAEIGNAAKHDLLAKVIDQIVPSEADREAIEIHFKGFGSQTVAPIRRHSPCPTSSMVTRKCGEVGPRNCHHNPRPSSTKAALSARGESDAAQRLKTLWRSRQASRAAPKSKSVASGQIATNISA